jgi:hypothetical protein
LLWSGILDFYDVARCLFGGVGLVGLATYPAPCGHTLQLAEPRTFGWKRKKKFSNSRRELGELDATGRRSGLRWTPVNARDRAGPATLGSHGGGATRRLGVTGP